jgi:hypothetical protein
LQRGNIFVFDDIIDSKLDNNSSSDAKENPNTPSAEQILKTYETVYLFKWIFPEKLLQNPINKPIKKV